MTGHRRLGAHTVEQHKFFAVLFNYGTAAFFVTGQHTAKHHEIRAAAECFSHIARHSTTAVADNLPAQAVRRVGAFNYGGKLRISDASFYASRTYGPRTNANLHNIGARKNQLFTHFTGHNVTRNNSFLRPGFASFGHKLHEVLGVTIRHINAHKAKLRVLQQYLLRFFEIRIGSAG